LRQACFGDPFLVTGEKELKVFAAVECHIEALIAIKEIVNSGVDREQLSLYLSPNTTCLTNVREIRGKAITNIYDCIS